MKNVKYPLPGMAQVRAFFGPEPSWIDRNVDWVLRAAALTFAFATGLAVALASQAHAARAELKSTDRHESGRT